MLRRDNALALEVRSSNLLQCANSLAKIHTREFWDRVTCSVQSAASFARTDACLCHLAIFFEEHGCRVPAVCKALCSLDMNRDLLGRRGSASSNLDSFLNDQ